MTAIAFAVGFSVVVIFVLFILFLLIRVKGERFVLWCEKAVPYFRHMKAGRPFGVRWKREELISEITPNLVQTLDGLIFKDNQDGVADEEREVRVGIDSDFAEYWKKVRASSSEIKIWCYAFNRPWYIEDTGEKGRYVYAYCLFSLSEMVRKFGRKNVIEGLFAETPLDVYDPTLEEKIVEAREKAKLKGKTPTVKQLKNVKKTYM
ncbi:MAG: hypothetical protein NWF06_03705, partial [Candidatus Bathyarchaeota archaeon]|nr:hypothetical protein [Candidatus Bathyarchaeum sp.]